MTLDAEKARARKAAFARRKAAKGSADEAAARQHLEAVLARHSGQPLAGYMPIRTEIDPLPFMAEWQAPVAVPVIKAAGLPLTFHRWQPDAEMVEGPFGARVPAVANEVVPRVVIVPLVAFDAQGGRLGYGGGFYDRTLEGLRARGEVFAVGFAFEAQRAEAALPLEPTDQPLDAIVTEAGLYRFSS